MYTIAEHVIIVGIGRRWLYVVIICASQMYGEVKNINEIFMMLIKVEVWMILERTTSWISHHVLGVSILWGSKLDIMCVCHGR